MTNDRILRMCQMALIAAAYVVLTIVNPLSFGMFQFRVSGVLSVLPLLDRRFAPALLLGVAIANLYSPLGVIDVAVGLAIGVICYYGFKTNWNIYLKCLLYACVAGLLVGCELNYVAQAPFLYSALSVAGSMIVVLIIGIPVCQGILKVLRLGLKAQ